MSGHAMQRPCGGASWKLALLSAFFRLVQKQAMCCVWKKVFCRSVMRSMARLIHLILAWDGSCRAPNCMRLAEDRLTSAEHRENQDANLSACCRSQMMSWSRKAHQSLQMEIALPVRGSSLPVSGALSKSR